VIDVLTLVVFLGLIDTGLLLEFVLPPGAGQGRALLLGISRHDWGTIHFWLSVATVVLVVVHVVLHWNWIYTTVRKHALGAPRPASGGSGRWLAGGVTGALMLCLTLGVVGLLGALEVDGDRESPGRQRHGRAGQATHSTEEAAGTPDETARQPARSSRGETGRGQRGRGADAGEDGHRSRGAGEPHDERGESLRGSMTFAQVARSTGLSVETVVAAADLPPETSPDARVGRTLRDHESDMEQLRTALAELVEAVGR